MSIDSGLETLVRLSLDVDRALSPNAKPFGNFGTYRGEPLTLIRSQQFSEICDAMYTASNKAAASHVIWLHAAKENAELRKRVDVQSSMLQSADERILQYSTEAAYSKLDLERVRATNLDLSSKLTASEAKARVFLSRLDAEIARRKDIEASRSQAAKQLLVSKHEKAELKRELKRVTMSLSYGGTGSTAAVMGQLKAAKIDRSKRRRKGTELDALPTGTKLKYYTRSDRAPDTLTRSSESGANRFIERWDGNTFDTEITYIPCEDDATPKIDRSKRTRTAAEIAALPIGTKLLYGESQRAVWRSATRYLSTDRSEHLSDTKDGTATMQGNFSTTEIVYIPTEDEVPPPVPAPVWACCKIVQRSNGKYDIVSDEKPGKFFTLLGAWVHDSCPMRGVMSLGEAQQRLPKAEASLANAPARCRVVECADGRYDIISDEKPGQYFNNFLTTKWYRDIYPNRGTYDTKEQADSLLPAAEAALSKAKPKIDRSLRCRTEEEIVALPLGTKLTYQYGPNKVQYRVNPRTGIGGKYYLADSMWDVPLNTGFRGDTEILYIPGEDD